MCAMHMGSARHVSGRRGLSATAAAAAEAAASASNPAALPHAARRALSARPATANAGDGVGSEGPSDGDWEGGADAAMGGLEGFVAREWDPTVRRTGALAMKVGDLSSCAWVLAGRAVPSARKYRRCVLLLCVCCNRGGWSRGGYMLRFRGAR